MKPGFLYALQPEGMSIVKVGSTYAPAQRIEQIASFSPVQMRFRHLLDVGSFSAALIHEHDILGWSRESGGHGEWRTDLALIDDLFAGVAPAVDVADQYDLALRKPARGVPLYPHQISDRLVVSAFIGEFGSEWMAASAIGYRSTGSRNAKVFVAKAREWLRQNRPDVLERVS